MKSGKGLLAAFGVSCAPPIERQTRTDLRVRPPSVDTLWPLAIASMAPLHRIGRRGEPLLIEKRQRFVQRGGTALLERVSEGREPLDTPPQRGQCGEGRLGPTAPLA